MQAFPRLPLLHQRRAALRVARRLDLQPDDTVGAEMAEIIAQFAPGDDHAGAVEKRQRNRPDGALVRIRCMQSESGLSGISAGPRAPTTHGWLLSTCQGTAAGSKAPRSAIGGPVRSSHAAVRGANRHIASTKRRSLWAGESRSFSKVPAEVILVCFF